MRMIHFIIAVFILLFVFPLPQHASSVTFPTRPPLPEEHPAEDQRIMIVVKKDQFNEIKKQLNKTPEINIHQTYQHVFYGFSIEGPRDVLQALRNNLLE